MSNLVKCILTSHNTRSKTAVRLMCNHQNQIHL